MVDTLLSNSHVWNCEVVQILYKMCYMSTIALKYKKKITRFGYAPICIKNSNADALLFGVTEGRLRKENMPVACF